MSSTCGNVEYPRGGRGCARLPGRIPTDEARWGNESLLKLLDGLRDLSQFFLAQVFHCPGRKLFEKLGKPSLKTQLVAENVFLSDGSFGRRISFRPFARVPLFRPTARGPLAWQWQRLLGDRPSDRARIYRERCTSRETKLIYLKEIKKINQLSL